MSNPLPNKALDWPTADEVVLLARQAVPPCVSLYIPLRAGFEGHLENARRFGLLAAETSDCLAQAGIGGRALRAWSSRLDALATSASQQRVLPGGSAIFLDGSAAYAYRLPVPPEQTVRVSETFALREALWQTDMLRDGPKRRSSPPTRSSDVALMALDRILVAVHYEKVRILWAQRRVSISGRLDPRRPGTLPGGPGDDLLDHLVARVLACGGDVHVVGSDQMPRQLVAIAEL